MRIVFAGSPDFAAASLAALIEAAPAHGWSIPLVLTQPDRPAGRGLRSHPSAVREVAAAHGLAVATPVTLSLTRGGAPALEAHAQLRAAAADVLVVAAYGLILPQAVLDLPRGLPDAGAGPLRAINVHASLLPRWRGAAPIVRAIEAGDTTTGITLMQMEAGLDTGPMLRACALPIDPDDTGATLTARLAALGAQCLVTTLEAAARGDLRATPQPSAGVTWAHKLARAEAWIDWTQPAATICARIRAFDPFPGACTALSGTVLKLWRGTPQPIESDQLPGTVLAATAEGIVVACGDGALRLTQLQRPGGRRLAAREFLAGVAVTPGSRLATPPENAP